MKATTKVVTPLGNEVRPMTVAEALMKVAERLRGRFEPQATPMARAGLLHGLLCDVGAKAEIRFHALAAIRTVALGSPDPGPLGDALATMNISQMADILERAAKL